MLYCKISALPQVINVALLYLCQDKKATSLVALPPAGPNPHKSLSSASSSSSGIGSVSHATGRPHVHKLHAVGSGSDSTSNNSEGALNNVGADHKGALVLFFAFYNIPVSPRQPNL